MQQPLIKYAVYVHGYDLPMRDVDGRTAIGGLYAWRVVDAANRVEAIAAAIRDVCSDGAYIDEVIRSNEIAPRFEAEDVRTLSEYDERTGTAIIFYIDTDAPS